MTPQKTKRMLLRIISVICIMALCLTFFIGCNENILSEDFEKDLSNANVELKTLKKDYDAALEKNKTLTNDNETAKQEIDALKNSNQSANQEIETLKGANESANKEISELKATNENAQKELGVLKDANETSQKELDALKKANETALKEIEELKEQINDLLNYITPDSPGEKIRIYIDQGHNPTSNHNSGAVSNGLYEENITYTVGRLLAGLLQFDGRFEVCLSRPFSTTVLGTDNTSSLEARVQGAKAFEADYFISLHVNAYESESANGTEVYTTTASGTSYEFGSALLDGIIETTKLNNRGMKQKSFYVLSNATMPAALVEMGFITNPNDAKLLSEAPELFAKGLYNGILNYFNLLPINSTSN